MLDLRRLHVFKAVADRRSFSEAALDLNYTQSSVSQHVTNLERELGASLIDRAARPVALTPAGEILLRRADDLLGRAASIEREVESLKTGELGQLRLGGFYTAWATFLPGAVAEYSTQHPDVQLELRQLEPDPATRALLAGDLDLAVARFEAITGRPEDDRIEWIHLLDDPYAVALPAGHRLASKRTVSLAHLADERWVSPPPGTPYTLQLHDLCQRHGGFEPNVVYETIDIAMAQPLVAAGLAVAMLPALGLKPQHEGVVARPLPSIPPARSVEVGRLKGVEVPTAPAMVDALHAAARAEARRSAPRRR